MIKIGLCGYGTVGHGVKELIDSLSPKEAKLVKVFDLPEKQTELGSLLVTDWKEITEDEEISTVIECMGGDKLPYQIIMASLKSGKNVISSNKETISLHLREYLQTAKLNHCTIQFEASCGGGIPLIYPLYNISLFDRINSIYGILNGTSNFILTKMQQEKMSFATALTKAQDDGFAEKDPSADLNGLDIARKSNILASLVYKKEISTDQIARFGIEKISSDILDFLQERGFIVKLVADISRNDETINISVLPVLFKRDNPIAQVQYETNGILASCQHNGPIFFSGKGAGKQPTASAIIQDLERVLSSTAPHFDPGLTKVDINPDLTGRFYCFLAEGTPQILLNPSLAQLKQFRFIAKENQR